MILLQGTCQTVSNMVICGAANISSCRYCITNCLTLDGVMKQSFSYSGGDGDLIRDTQQSCHSPGMCETEMTGKNSFVRMVT